MKDGIEIPPDELPVQRAAATGVEVRDYEFDLVFENESVRHWFGNAAPILNEDGSPTGAVGAFVDITDRKRAETALREADQQKTKFMAVLSHELRNPLAPIRNSALLLKRAPSDVQRVQRAASVIERQVTHLTRLVDDLLDVNRIAHGKVQLRVGEVELRELVQHAVEDHRSALEVNNIQVRLEVPGHPVCVRVDATRIAQVIGNLLHNAAKFTNAGGLVTIGVDEPTDGGYVRVRVTDSGRGIAPDVKTRIFEPFAQASVDPNCVHGGLGLGLVLVKGLVELHGGVVDVFSDGIGKGAEFTFTLPLATEPCHAGRVLTVLPKLKRRKVAIVEDNVDGAESLRDILELAHHEVHVAFSGAAGISTALERRVEVVLCDIGLPDMTGFEVARALKQKGFTGRLVALTGYASAKDEKHAAEAGFHHHLPKPPDLDRLTAILNE